MTELTDTLEKVIQQAALDGALTADAVSQFHSLVVERNALKDANEEWEEADEKHKKEFQKISERCDNMQQQILLHVERESELADREKEITQLECKAEHMEERVKDHKEMFTTVFRNSVLRKEIMSPQYDFMDSNGSSRSSSEMRHTLEEEEK